MLDGVGYGGISTGLAFHRGALESPDGVAIICLASRTPAGRSAISVELSQGEAVAIPRADVHWVITEYGTAYLFGRSLSERAVALIELFYRLSEDDVRTRFFRKLSSLTDTAAQHLCSVDYEEEMAFAAVVGPSEHERIVAASSYYLSPASGLAEVAYMVDPDWQGAGLGSILHAGLVDYARRHGARGLRADVLPANRGMMRVLQRGDHTLSVHTDAGVQELKMLFEPSR